MLLKCNMFHIFHTYISGGSDSKESACNVGNLGLVLGSGKSPGEGNGNPLQYSCLEHPLDIEDWQAIMGSQVVGQY